MSPSIAALVVSLISIASPALADRKIAETCTGSETVQVGTQPQKTVAYTLTFSADLDAKVYCYGPCGEQQSYPISDTESSPIKLADIHWGSQIRELTFDPATSRVTDIQVFHALDTITRRAAGVCIPTAFQAPTPQRQTGR